MGSIMKSLMVFVLLLTAVMTGVTKPNNDREFILKFGIQPLNTLSRKSEGNNVSFNTKIGFSAGFEYFQYLNNIAALGLGAMYDFPRKAIDNDNDDDSISFVPLFAAVKLRTPAQGLDNDNTFMFCSGRIGASIPIISGLSDGAKQKPGFYCGAGIGFNINYIVIEAIYAINNFSVSGDFGKNDFDCQTISLYAGFKFK
ncbi:MAG: hypothetical protein LBU10_00610 [Endomicrobium sp.]|jgi:hypothetical protein|nr:hypothetical protein [Endomicrobium sp.]